MAATLPTTAIALRTCHSKEVGSLDPKELRHYLTSMGHEAWYIAATFRAGDTSQVVIDLWEYGEPEPPPTKPGETRTVWRGFQS